MANPITAPLGIGMAKGAQKWDTMPRSMGYFMQKGRMLKNCKTLETIIVF
jgi:hypothetical protein